VADIVAFEDWYEKLKRQAVELFNYSQEAVDSFDERYWKEYYLDGFTPKDALQEEAQKQTE